VTEGFDTMALRTLYVEDDDVVRELTVELLEESGLAITDAGTAAEALAAFDEAAGHAPFELLITDIGLPDMPGMELARLLAARAPQLRVVFSSGYAMPRRLEGWNGRAGSVDKPIDLDTLAEVLRELGLPADADRR
jgi:CheY-like chemotaxis protein